MDVAQWLWSLFFFVQLLQFFFCICSKMFTYFDCYILSFVAHTKHAHDVSAIKICIKRTSDNNAERKAFNENSQWSNSEWTPFIAHLPNSHSRTPAYDITNTFGRGKQQPQKKNKKNKQNTARNLQVDATFTFHSNSTVIVAVQKFIFIGGYSMNSAALPVVESITMLLSHWTNTHTLIVIEIGILK